MKSQRTMVLMSVLIAFSFCSTMANAWEFFDYSGGTTDDLQHVYVYDPNQGDSIDYAGSTGLENYFDPSLNEHVYEISYGLGTGFSYTDDIVNYGAPAGFQNTIAYDFWIKSAPYQDPPYTNSDEAWLVQSTVSLPENITLSYSFNNQQWSTDELPTYASQSIIAKITRYNSATGLEIQTYHDLDTSSPNSLLTIENVTPQDRFRLEIVQDTRSGLEQYPEYFSSFGFNTQGALKIVSTEPVWSYSSDSLFSGNDYYRALYLTSDAHLYDYYLYGSGSDTYDPTHLNHEYYQGYTVAQSQNGPVYTPDDSADPRVVSNSLTLAEREGVTGEYNLHRGTLQTTYSLVGEDGTGTFRQTGGTHETEHLLIQAHSNGVASTGTGSYIKTAGTLDADTITNNGQFKHYGGELVSDQFINNGYFQGVGTLDIGTFVNNGILAPGNSPGELIIDGDLIQNGKLVMELAWDETSASWLQDSLQVSGSIFKGTNSLLEIAFRGIDEDSLIGQTFDLGDYFDFEDDLANLFDDVTITTIGWLLQTDIDPLVTGSFEITAKAAVVPLPGAALLFGSGLLGLLGLRQRRIF